MNKRDYYEVLGLAKGATKVEIKSAYRKLAKKFHPDRNKDADAESNFKEVQEAYDILSDERKKDAYDKYGHAGTQSFGGSGGGYGYGDGGFGGFDSGDFGSINDIFEQFFGGSFGGASGFGQRSSSSSSPKRGSDLEVTLKIKFEEAIFGEEKSIIYKRKIVCDVCNGTGAKSESSIKTCDQCNGRGKVTQVQRTFLGNFQTITTCPKCSGTGKVIKDLCPKCEGHGINSTEQEFKIKVPQGIPDGVTLKFREMGNAGPKGGSYGDLYINIEVKEHGSLERKGDDIYVDMDITPEEAVLGATKSVLTVFGEDNVKIPSGTQPDAILKMSQKGAPKFRGSGNGDQYVKINIKIPTKLTRDQKELWSKLNEIKEEKPGFFEGVF